MTDARAYIIPDEFSLGGLGLGILFALAAGRQPLGTALLGAAVGFGLLWLVAVAGQWYFKQEAMGGGDVKMMAMVGAFLGWQGTLLTVFLGALDRQPDLRAALAGRQQEAGAVRHLPRDRRGGHLPGGPVDPGVVRRLPEGRVTRLAGIVALALAALAAACRGQSRDAREDTVLAALVDSLRAPVERATGLRFRTPPRSSLRSKEQVRAYLIAKLDEELPPARMQGLETAYRLFGLLPDTLALRGLLLDLYAEQVAGYYDPDSATLFGVAGADRGQLRLVLAHEMVHALQGQHLPLDSILKSTSSNDRLTAAQSILEGQATLASIAVLAPGQDVAAAPQFWEMYRDQVRQQQAAMPVFARAPLVVREALIFPYLDGAEFMHWWETKGPKDTLPYGPRMPVSTEQILHPDRYARGDMPVTLAFAAGRRRGLRGCAGGERDPGAARGARGVGRGADGGADRLGRRPVPGLPDPGGAGAGMVRGVGRPARGGPVPEGRRPAAQPHLASGIPGRAAAASRWRAGPACDMCSRPRAGTVGGAAGGEVGGRAGGREGEKARGPAKTESRHWRPRPRPHRRHALSPSRPLALSPARPLARSPSPARPLALSPSRPLALSAPPPA